MWGDKIADVTPAHELGGVGALVRTGYGEDEATRVPAGTAVVEDLVGVARLILSGGWAPPLTPLEASGIF